MTNESSSVQPQARKGRMLTFSLGTRFVALVAVIAASLTLTAPRADAAIYTVIGGTVNWSASASWTPPGVPGTGDTAIIALASTINVDTNVNGVILSLISSGTNINIPAGGALKLEPSSSLNSSNNINVNGGTLAYDTGTTNSSSNITLNTGTLNLIGNLSMVAGGGTFQWNGGQISGSGTLNNPSSNGLNITGTGGGMILTGATIDNFGTITYSSATAQSLSINSGAHIKNESGSSFQITGTDPIQSDLVSSPSIDVLSGAGLSKGGATSSTVGVPVNNAGTVSPGTGTLILSQGGTHVGAFSLLGSTGVLGFNSTTTPHTFNPGANVAGGSLGIAQILGGNFNVNTTSGSPIIFPKLNQLAGTVGSTGYLKVSSIFNWTGGIQNSSGTTEIAIGATANLNGNSPVTLDTGRLLLNNGTLNYAPSAVVLSINNGAKVTNNGTFDLQNDASINSSTPSASSIDNALAGSLKKSGGTSTSIACVVSFAGTSSIVPNAGGSISMGAGGSWGGAPVTIDLSAAGSSVQLAGGNFLFSGGAGSMTATGSGKLRLMNSASLGFTTGPLSINNFQQDGTSSLFSSVQALAINGVYDWTGGTIDGNNAGQNIVNVNGGATMNLTGSTGPMTLTNTAFLTNAGTLNYNASANNLNINNSATIVSSIGSFNYTSALGVFSNQIGAPAIRISSGTLSRIGAGTPQIDAVVNIITPGALTTNGGSIRLAGGGTSSGGMNPTQATDRVEISGLTYTLNAGVNVTGSGRIAVLGNAALNTALSLANWELDNGGTVATTAAGLLTINGTLFWNGGTFSGPGTVTLLGGSTGNLTAPTGPPTIADGILFVNNGTISYNPLQSLTFKNSGPGGATFNNGVTGVFDIQGNGSTAAIGAGHSFNVLGGTVKKSAGTGVFLFTIPYNQSGGTTDAQVANAIIGITGGGSFTNGSMQALAAGAEIAFNSTPAYTVNGGGFAGTVALKGGTLTAAGPIVAPPTFNQIAGTLNGASTLTLPSGSTYTMTGGVLTPASVSISSGGQLTLDSTTNSLTLGAITNNAGGNILWSAGANFITNSGASGINNIGVMDLRGSGTFGSAVGGTLNSTGTLKKTVGTGTISIVMPVAITNGLLSVQAGTLNLASTAAVTHGGSFDVQAGTTLSFSNGSHTLGVGSVFTGGTGNVDISSPAVVTLNTNVAIPTLELWGGQLTGGGNLSSTVDFYWDGGTMDGTGTTTVTGGFDFMTGPMTLGRNLVIPGNTTFSLGSSTLSVVNAVSITNGGTFDMQGGNIACVACTATFLNNGTLQASAGIDSVAVPITGTGALVVNGGTFNGQAAESFSTAAIDNGNAQFTGNPVTIGSVTNAGVNPGVISVMGGATTIAGSVGFGAVNSTLAIYAGTLTLNGTTAAVNFALNAGTVNGSGAVTAGSSFVFNSGTLGGSGSFTSNGTGALSGSGGGMSLSRSLINNGTMTYSPTVPSNILTAGANVTITNNGTFDFTNQNLTATAVPIAQFVNGASGIFRRIAGAAGTLNFDPAVSNAGTTLLSLGTTNFTNGFTQTAGTTTMNGGNVSTPATMAINAGTLNAFGAITGNLTNGGIVNVKNSTTPAALAVTGNFTQTSGGTLNVLLNGTTPGTTYSQLNVTNNVVLDGTLFGNVGYAPINGDILKPLTFGGRPGGTDFATKTFTPLPIGVNFNTAYIAGPPQALQITVATPTADLSITQSAPGTALQGQNVPITLTVSNGGPAAATATITDTFSNAAFVSATAGAGGACTGTGPVTCSFTGLANGATGMVTVMLNANTVGTITNNASVSSGSTLDPNTANNNAAAANITVTTGADLVITKTSNNPGPSGNVVYTVTVINNGPSTASGITISDPSPAALTFMSATGACTTFPCAISSLANGNSATVIATYSVNHPGSQTIFNTATVTASTADPNTSNNSATATTSIGCPTAPATSQPGNATTGLPLNGTLFWSGNGGQFKVYLGPVGSGCQTLVGTTNTNSLPYAGLQPATQYEWRVESIATGCPTLSSACSTFTTAPSCAQPPAPTAPASGATVSSPVTFVWSGVPGAVDYHLFASTNGGASLDLGTTASTTLTLSIGDGAVVWYVVANVPTCGQLQSPSSSFTACSDLPPPVAGVVANATSAQSYDVAWDAIPGASKYEVDEASSATFAGATTKTVTTTSASFQHTVTTATAFFYRVRAFGGCKVQFSAYSNNARVVLAPVVAAGPGQSPNANLPAGSTLKVIQTVFIPGLPSGTFPFVATVDQPWLSVSPPSGSLTPAGVTLQVVGDPANLPNGTFTGTVIVTIGSGSGAKASNAVSTVSVPISISLVTPVKPGNAGTPPANSLIIPSVGHLDGVNSKWQSDVRLANPTATRQSYALTFTPDDPTQGVKTTTITVASNDTTALDDIVRNWYGVGTLGESANGVLLIVPATSSGSGKGGPVENVSVQTVAVASSRTYNVTSTGTLGQFIPAIPFSSFIGKSAAILSLQQIAQNNAFRTNLGLVEGSGNPATVLLSVFSNGGGKLFEQSVDLKANQQVQLNSFLATNGITLNDGRIEVSVTGGTGKVTAYASVVDNVTGDPLLVSGVPAGAASNHFILPGVAALNNGVANWRSDVRIYNSGTAPQATTLTLYPLNSTSAPVSNAIVLNGGEVRSLDDIVKSYFGLDNTGGSLHVTTSGDAPLVVSGRTYNLTSNGTYGQFISAVTPNDAVGRNERALNVLQVEDSVRYRTNLGLAEVTGNPVSVEVSVFLPDSKVIPKVTFNLGANEYRQTAILHDLGLSNIYNARISVRVVDGDGKVTAYGSVIDMQTQDPTYVPAQ